jgi:DNA-binding transcriptional LysR family regulator
VLAQHQAVAQGCGIGVLPAFVADGDSRLQKVLPEQTGFVRTFWISMPSEYRDIARMQEVWSLLRTAAQRVLEAPQ